MPKPIVFVIHGISDGSNVKRDFEQFSKNLNAEFKRLGKHKLQDNFHLVMIDWQPATIGGKSLIYKNCFGVPTRKDRALVDSVLSPTEIVPCLFGPVFHLPNPCCPVLPRWHAWRGWRYFATLFVGDMIAYTNDNDNGIRASVWEQMEREFAKHGDDIPEFTLIGHSLGSVISFDFVFALLAGEEPHLFNFSERKNKEESFGYERLQKLRQSFRSLITIGSPIGLFLMRNKKFWPDDLDMMKNSGLAKVENLINPLDAKKHKWINMLDTDDFVGYPLETIFSGAVNSATAALPKDEFINSSWLPPWAHVNYWKNGQVAKIVSKCLLEQKQLVNAGLKKL